MAEQMDMKDIIPHCAENALAALWPSMAAREGHCANLPSMNAQHRRQQAGKKRANVAGHAKTAQGIEIRAKILRAIAKGHVTTSAIGAALGHRTPEGARRQLRILHERGLVEPVGETSVRGGRAKIWRLKP